jgi:hypothetical protein
MAKEFEHDGNHRISRQKNQQKRELYYWIAINGPTTALSNFALPKTVKVSPTPQRLLGFKSRQKQLEVNNFLLNDTAEKIQIYFNEVLPELVKIGEAVDIIYENSENYQNTTTRWEI